LRGNPEEALARLENIPTGADHAEALAARSQLRIELKQFAPALKDLEQLTVLRPGDMEPAAQLGYCYCQLSRFDEALEAFRAAGAFVSVGICLLRTKQPEEALEAFERALQQPGDPGPGIVGGGGGEEAGIGARLFLVLARGTGFTLPVQNVRSVYVTASRRP
jgi:tetratricopeptide (TPR) repeat protein